MANRNADGLISVGLVLIGLSLASLGYFATAFDVSVSTATASAALPKEARELIPDRVANLERMNKRQNGIIASSAGLVVGALVGLFGWHGRSGTAGMARIVDNSIECPACGLLNPISATRCDCGQQFSPTPDGS